MAAAAQQCVRTGSVTVQRMLNCYPESSGLYCAILNQVSASGWQFRVPLATVTVDVAQDQCKQRKCTFRRRHEWPHGLQDSHHQQSLMYPKQRCPQRKAS
eukprot:scpid23146/ scgid33898/ 